MAGEDRMGGLFEPLSPLVPGRAPPAHEGLTCGLERALSVHTPALGC